MRSEPAETVDLWRQVASAVEYIAAVERPGFTVWDALSEAILAWSGRSLASVEDGNPDRLRAALVWLLQGLPPTGAPGGVRVAEAFASALANWMEASASVINDEVPFGTLGHSLTVQPEERTSNRWL